MFAPELPSVHVGIRIIGDYGDAKEFPDPDPAFGYDGEFPDTARSKIRGYIESKDNHEFEVVISVTDDRALDEYVHGDDGLQFTVFVDGEHMGKRFLRDHHLSGRNGGFWQSKFIGKKLPGPAPGTRYLRRFVFAPMRTVEDSTTDEEIRRARALGTIEVVVRPARFMGFTRGRRGGNRHREVDNPDVIPGYPYSEISEKALKGRSITHSIAYSQPEEIGGPGDGRGGRLDSKTTDHGWPLISFLYKYRSAEGMKREGAIPRSPPPDYKVCVPKAEELSRHELDRLARKQLRQMKRLCDEAHLGDQHPHGDQTTLGKRGREAYDLTGEERQSKLARVDPRDIIDLTQDDQYDAHTEELRYDDDNDVVLVDS